MRTVGTSVINVALWKRQCSDERAKEALTRLLRLVGLAGGVVCF